MTKSTTQKAKTTVEPVEAKTVHLEPLSDEGLTQVESPSNNDDKQDLPLLSLATLADGHRVASWQQAALLRLMGWEDDKLVTDADYVRALESLKHRHMGGGRFMAGRKA